MLDRMLVSELMIWILVFCFMLVVVVNILALFIDFYYTVIIRSYEKKR